MTADVARRPSFLLVSSSGTAMTLARRLPLTLLTVATILIVTAVTETMMEPISRSQLQFWGFGLGALREGRLDKLLLTPFQVYRPYMVVTISTSLLFFLGTCEYVIGTRRALIAFWVGHLAAYLGTFLLLWPLEASGVDWAVRMTREPDVGASAASFAVAGAALPFLPSFLRKLGFTLLLAYLLGLLALGRRVWDVEHLIAFPVGLAIGIYFQRRQGGPFPALVAWPRFSPRQRPAVAAFAVGALGLISVFSAFLSPRTRTQGWIEDAVPFGLDTASRNLALLAGVALLLLSQSLSRGRRRAWQICVAILGGLVVLHLGKGADFQEALIALALFALLLRWGDAFPAHSDPPSVRRGLMALATVAIALPLFGVLGFFILRFQYSEVYSVGEALRETGARLLFTNVGAYTATTRRATWFLDVIPIVGWAGILAALYLLLRGAVARPPSLSERETANRLLAAHGRSGTAYMTLWPNNSIFLAPDGTAYLGYRQVAGVALALGDPIGAEAAVAATVTAFDRFAREHGLTPAFYGAATHLVPVYQQCGFRTLQIGEEALISLPEMEFKGREWQDIRSALNRARRDGVTFRLYEGGSVPSPVRDQLFGIAAAWLAEKDLPEMGFTLGRTEDVDDPNVYVAVALDADGRVHGYLDWLPMYAARGWVIDLMRRAPEAMPGIMEFLIGSSLLAFKERGDQVASLAAAPLADLDRADSDDALTKALGFIATHGNAFYQFESLFAFKKKFQPRWQAVHLVYPSAADLPRITLAILKAHMPMLGPRMIADLVGAAIAERFDRSSAPEPGRGADAPLQPPTAMPPTKALPYGRDAPHDRPSG